MRVLEYQLTVLQQVMCHAEQTLQIEKCGVLYLADTPPEETPAAQTWTPTEMRELVLSGRRPQGDELLRDQSAVGTDVRRSHV